ncbi:uncharacterized protein K441DRAFT_663227 [Cenococcum geophilum 1.58]|uniref:uncharacterized protein n=1 Tax=Cenococcum geophilum 1.58 TaxID=794803 RepID=UPI00359012B4|nr:hypothetical protein K441DRAFT_663227 [Cenococcum geophilum 1.58]
MTVFPRFLFNPHAFVVENIDKINEQVLQTSQSLIRNPLVPAVLRSLDFNDTLDNWTKELAERPIAIFIRSHINHLGALISLAVFVFAIPGAIALPTPIERRFVSAIFRRFVSAIPVAIACPITIERRIAYAHQLVTIIRRHQLPNRALLGSPQRERFAKGVGGVVVKTKRHDNFLEGFSQLPVLVVG